MGLITFHEEHIKPVFAQRWFPVVLEVGIQNGEHSKLLLRECARRLGRWIGVDPCPSDEAAALRRWPARTLLFKDTSLKVLPELVAAKLRADIITIDGDHNYHTVLNELRYAEQILKPDGTIFAHDVAWPYGRRDLYYEPSRIPAGERQPYAKGGMIKGQSALVEKGGINGHLCNATHEGGPRNGVLTAIEDFVSQSQGRWQLKVIPDEFGMGILTRAGASQGGKRTG